MEKQIMPSKGYCNITRFIAPDRITHCLYESGGSQSKLSMILSTELGHNISESKVKNFIYQYNLHGAMQLIKDIHREVAKNIADQRAGRVPEPPTEYPWIEIKSHDRQYKFNMETHQLWSPSSRKYKQPFILYNGKGHQYPAYSINIGTRKKINVTIGRLYLMCRDGLDSGLKSIRYQNIRALIAKQPIPSDPTSAYWDINEHSSELSKKNTLALLPIKYDENGRIRVDYSPSYSI
ncbi:hypothetical protein Q8W14_03935 [Photobacterium damselae subsp. piscicida]|nr:hypothetical protein [Photobacterium damselae subsp. piscicida]